MAGNKKINEAFKSGCIRGPYPQQWNSDTAWRIGRALPSFLGIDRIVIGRDARLTSCGVFESLSKGLTESGCDVYDIGLVDTPALYFANVRYGFRGSIMITASHNPKGDNGLKIHRENAVTVEKKTGLSELGLLINEEPGPAAEKKGKIEFLDIADDYISLLERFMDGIDPLKVVLDCSSGSAGRFIHRIMEKLPQINHMLLNEEPDGNFPFHGPNPLKEENRVQLKEKVLETGADFGICFDGDCDRAIFVTEKGEMVMPDLILPFLARYYLVHFPEKAGGDDGIIYDLRCSSNVREYVESLGGRAWESKTGHIAIQKTILENRGLIGAELAGHYYFRDFYGQDSAYIAMLMAFAIASKSGRKFSEIISEIKKYSFSGEINFRLGEPEKAMDFLALRYSKKGGKVDRREGVKAVFGDWWFLARTSNTEPVLRLVVEAGDDETMKQRVGELTRIINQYK